MKNSNKLIIFLIGIVILISALFLLNKAEKLTEKNSVSVYFIKSINKPDFRLTAVKRKISPENSSISVAMTELLKGPSDKEKRAGFYTEIPSKTKLIGIKEDSKQVIINLSNDFGSGGGSTSMILRTQQLVDTALDAVKDKPVYLEFDGKRVEAVGGEGLLVPQPLSRNLSGSRVN